MTASTPIPSGESARPGPDTGGASRRIVRGLAANIGGMGVTLVFQIVSVPVLLAAWGVPTYGEWLVLSAVPTYLALSDLSFSSVAGNSMVMLVAQGRRGDAIILGRRLWSIVTVTTGIAVLAAMVIALMFGSAFGGGAAIPASEARVVLFALFLQVAIGNQYGVLDAWYRAGGKVSAQHHPSPARAAARIRCPRRFGALGCAAGHRSSRVPRCEGGRLRSLVVCSSPSCALV